MLSIDQFELTTPGLNKSNKIGPTFFAQRKNFFVQLIFFPPKFFLVFWKRKMFLSKKKFGGK
jgi:hypothetical protein